MPIEYNNIPANVALIIPALQGDVSAVQTLPLEDFEIVVVSDLKSSDISYRKGATVVTGSEGGYGAACLRALAVLPETIDVVMFAPGEYALTAKEIRAVLSPIENNSHDLVLGIPPGASGGGRLSRHSSVRAIRLCSLRALGMKDRESGWNVEMRIRAVQQGLRITEVPVQLTAARDSGWPSSIQVIKTALKLWITAGAV
jgi:hypothetical protein